MRPYAAIITNAREKLGLSAAEVANTIGLKYYEYIGLEYKDDKINTTFPLTAICKLLIVLRMDPYEFFAVPRELATEYERDSVLATIQERLPRRIEETKTESATSKYDFELHLGFLIDNPNELAEGSLNVLYHVAWFVGVPAFSIFLEIFNKTKATFSYTIKPSLGACPM